MKIRFLITLTILTFNYCQISAQYYFTDFPISDDVVSVETIEANNSWFKPKERTVFVYENGKMKSMKSFKGKKLTLGKTYEYAFSDNKEIIKITSTKENLNYTQVNSFDDQNRLIKSEAFFHDTIQSSTLYQHDFIYNENNKITEYKITSIPFDYSSSSYLSERQNTTTIKIDYLNSFKAKKTQSNGTDKNSVSESIIEYDTTRSSAVLTEHSYFDISEGDRYMIYPKRKRLIEYYEVEKNGKKMTVKKIIRRTKYIFDKKGNWIKVYKFDEKGHMRLQRKRIIKYK